MKKIAHRGYKTNFIKENTIEAFNNAIDNDFLGFECDVHETKDKKLVVIHDAFIDRVSNGTGFVKDMTYKELLKYNFGSSEVKSTIPLLKDVLKMFKGYIKVIELKGRVDISSILEYIDDKTFFISFDTSYMEKLKSIYPNLKFGELNYVLNSSFKHDLDHVCILDDIAKEDVVMDFLKRGKRVFIYGIFGKVNYKRDYENLYYIVNKKNL